MSSDLSRVVSFSNLYKSGDKKYTEQEFRWNGGKDEHKKAVKRIFFADRGKQAAEEITFEQQEKNMHGKKLSR